MAANTCFAAAILLLSLFMLWNMDAEAAPHSGLVLQHGVPNPMEDGNMTAALSSLAETHARHIVDVFTQLTELSQLGLNLTNRAILIIM